MIHRPTPPVRRSGVSAHRLPSNQHLGSPNRPRRACQTPLSSIGEEIDFVIETGDRLLPIEVKATTRPRRRDTTALRTFQAEYGERSRPGLLLHTGTLTDWITPTILATPWSRLI